MSYEIVYGKLSLTEQEKEQQAIADLREWFGEAKFAFITETLDSVKTMAEVDSLDFAICFGGVTGYPVCCLFAHKWGWPFVERWSSVDRWDADTTIASVLAELEGQ